LALVPVRLLREGLAQHAGGAVLQGKLVAEGGKLSLLDAGFTWIDPKPKLEAATGGGAE
jgi:hypothetical protein